MHIPYQNLTNLQMHVYIVSLFTAKIIIFIQVSVEGMYKRK